jgi:hypothetical protein
MATLHNLGFPRIGENRELKLALEKYWRKELDGSALLAEAGQVKQKRLTQQPYLDYAQVGDFSLYDHVLDTSFLFGHIPSNVKRLNNTSKIAATLPTLLLYLLIPPLIVILLWHVARRLKTTHAVQLMRVR